MYFNTVYLLAHGGLLLVLFIAVHGPLLVLFIAFIYSDTVPLFMTSFPGRKY